jgi:hypothetical protein
LISPRIHALLASPAPWTHDWTAATFSIARETNSVRRKCSSDRPAELDARVAAPVDDVAASATSVVDPPIDNVAEHHLRQLDNKVAQLSVFLAEFFQGEMLF